MATENIPWVKWLEGGRWSSILLLFALSLVWLGVTTQTPLNAHIVLGMGFVLLGLALVLEARPLRKKNAGRS